MELDPDFKEFIALLNEHGVEYLLVGGYAVALHGYVRNTSDIDIWIRHTRDNADRMMRVIVQFGFGEVGLTAQDFERENAVIQLGYPPHRIDIVTTPDGVDFEECFRKKESIEISKGVPLYYIDRENLKKNKRASGRSQDLADLEHLTE